MKHTLLVLLLGALLPLSAVPGKDSPADPLAGAFFPPELVFLARDQIGLTQEQQEAFQDRVEKTQARSEELRVKLEREAAALAALAKQERVDEAVIVAQLDRVLDAERELKHIHIGLMVAIKNLLTPEQQAKLHEIAKGGGTQPAEATVKRLTEKVERLKAGMQKWAENGRDPSAIAQAMEQKFKPLIEAGKVIEAERVLDRLLEQLKTGKQLAATPATAQDDARKRLTDKVALVQAGAQKWQASGRDPSAIAQAMEQKFKPLMEAGKPVEAEAELDRVLELLKQDAR